MTATERLKEILISKGYNINSFCKKFGMPYTTVKNVLERSVENTTVNTIAAICKALEITIEDLLKMSDDRYSLDERALISVYRDLNSNSKQIIMTVAKMEQNHIRAEETAKKPIRILLKTKTELDHEIKLALPGKSEIDRQNYIKVFNQSAAAGYGNWLNDDSDFEDVAVPAIPRGAEFGIRISGNSMEPAMFNGDIVFVKRQPAIEIGQIGIFIVDNQAYCKQLIFKDNMYYLHSLNNLYNDIALLSEGIYTVGLVLDCYSS